jgi:hypothetical protein
MCHLYASYKLTDTHTHTHQSAHIALMVLTTFYILSTVLSYPHMHCSHTTTCKIVNNSMDGPKHVADERKTVG